MRPNLTTVCIVCAVLGMMSLFGTGLSLLALQDIWHGEPDVSLEWNIVRAAHLLLGAFYVATFYMIRRVLKHR